VRGDPTRYFVTAVASGWRLFVAFCLLAVLTRVVAIGLVRTGIA